MNSYSSVLVLAALGALAGPAAAAPAVDTSQWKCEGCPADKGTSGTLEAGVGNTSAASARYGDYSGLDRKGTHLVAGGNLRWRSGEGGWGDLAATDLGLDTRTLSAQGGLEGLFKLQLGYAETPHWLSDSGRTPFQGVGSDRLTLPFAPAASTAAMPLADTLQPVATGFKRKRYDAGASLQAVPDLNLSVSVRRDTRDGLQRLAGSFYSTSSALLLPIDQVTDQLEVAAAYASGTLRGSVAWQLSRFRNHDAALTWDNPFTPVVAGAGSGQMALAPDNQFHQLYANAGWDPLPEVQVSGEIAAGTMTQDQPFLAPTLNPNLGVTAADLPQSSLQGRVKTFNGSLRVSATPMQGLRLHGTYARDLRDNRTPSNTYPAVSTDMFVGATERTNLPYDFKQDRLKAWADWRGPAKLLLSGGFEYDRRDRSYQEVVNTHETTWWARGSMPMGDNALSLKLAHADRQRSTYGTVVTIDPPENPLLRKYNLADRLRDSVGLRLDTKPAENATVTLHADWSNDDYTRSPIGLTDGTALDMGVDLAVQATDDLQIRAFGQFERARSRQAGSALYATPDWRASSRDGTEVLGLGLRQMLLKGKLQLDGDITVARSRSRTVVDAGPDTAAFPQMGSAQDTLRLQATWQMRPDLALVGSWWFERYSAADWHYDGVGANTVSNLLALGEQPAQYHVNVVRVAVRYRF